MIKYKGPVFNVVETMEKLPNGRTMKFSKVDKNQAIMLIPVIGNKIVIVHEYRPAIRKWVYQLSAGLIEKGHTPQATARKELREELGYVAGKMTFLFAAYTTTGISNDRINFFVAEKLKKTERELEPGEVITPRSYTVDKLMDMIRTGKIQDDNTIAGLMYYKYIFLPNQTGKLKG